MRWYSHLWKGSIGAWAVVTTVKSCGGRGPCLGQRWWSWGETLALPGLLVCIYSSVQSCQLWLVERKGKPFPGKQEETVQHQSFLLKIRLEKPKDTTPLHAELWWLRNLSAPQVYLGQWLRRQGFSVGRGKVEEDACKWMEDVCVQEGWVTTGRGQDGNLLWKITANACISECQAWRVLWGRD